jgi:hypothetical protein
MLSKNLARSRSRSASDSRLALLLCFGAVGALGPAIGCSGARATELDDVLGAAAQNPATPAPPAASGSSPSPQTGSDSGPKTEPEPNGDSGTDGAKPVDETLCDDGLALASSNAYDAAKAIGLCKKVSPGSPGWGVLEAKWSKPDGTAIASPTSWGLLPKLGSNLAPAGKAMLALSTGAARGPADPGYQAPASGFDKGYTHGVPSGQPKKASVCALADVAPGPAHDGVALELRIRVPNDAKSMSFTHQFFTADAPSDVCTEFNDAFVAIMEPKPAGTDGNIVFDSHGDLVGRNSASLLRACAPVTSKGLAFTCPLGTTSLVGTGFDDKAATGWLRTTVPVTSGSEITLKLMVWDSGDGTFDSTVLVDELSFSTKVAGATLTVPR